MSRVYKGLGVCVHVVRVLSRSGSPCRQSRAQWGTFGKVRGLKGVRAAPHGAAVLLQGVPWVSTVLQSPSQQLCCAAVGMFREPLVGFTPLPTSLPMGALDEGFGAGANCI